MQACFVTDAANARPIHVVTPAEYNDWLNRQDAVTKNWLAASNFKVDDRSTSIVPGEDGQVKLVVCCVNDKKSLWSVGGLAMLLPPGQYQVVNAEDVYTDYAIAWALGAYQFIRYKKATRVPAQLVVPKDKLPLIENMVTSLYTVRDLINTPTDDMGPTEFARAAETIAKECQAEFRQIVGEDLLKENYAAIHMVGRASDDAPRLIDMRWGNPSHPKVTLVGKGVCFDSGGLDIKPSAYMLLMKKDMAGGAHVLGLARMIMQAKLPVRLRVLIPVVENVISGNAYRPGDVVKGRKGLTIEIGNTDAEGRVVLSDALTEAVSENPELLIDISTLTGAARVAVGTEIAALFSNNNAVVNDVIAASDQKFDPVWRLPLYAPYRESLNSAIADINNNSSDSYAGAITAALFLKEFVPDNIPWLHYDMMAWNLRARPGRPVGAEAMGLRGLFTYLANRYKN